MVRRIMEIEEGVIGQAGKYLPKSAYVLAHTKAESNN